jgi:hypothetical protein
LGYGFCDYRKCSWGEGDYIQEVSPCDGSTLTREVKYTLKNGSKCIDRYIPSRTIVCEFTPRNSALGITVSTLSVFGALICLIVLVVTLYHKEEAILKRSQLIFVETFLVGATLLNLVVFVLIGPDTDTSCMLRPWLFNLSATLMFAPLIMKLHRVDRLFNNKMKKVKVTNTMVMGQIGVLLLGDVIILVLWSVLDTPSAKSQYNEYAGVLDAVDDTVCSTGLRTTFERIMVIYKILMILFAIAKV